MNEFEAKCLECLGASPPEILPHTPERSHGALASEIFVNFEVKHYFF